MAHPHHAQIRAAPRSGASESRFVFSRCRFSEHRSLLTTFQPAEMSAPSSNPPGIMRPTCMRCGYSLDGVMSQFRTCPECGADNDAEMDGAVKSAACESARFSRNLALGFPILATVLMMMAYLLTAVVFSWRRHLPFIIGAMAIITVLVDGFAMAMWFSADWRASGDRGMRPRHAALGGIAAICYCSLFISIGIAMILLGPLLILWMYRCCG